MAWKLKVDPETPFLFTPGGSGTGGNLVPFDIQGLAAGKFWMSGFTDLGSGPRTARFWWQARSAFSTAETPGSYLSFYAATCDDNDLTNADGFVPGSGVGNSLVTGVAPVNLHFIGALVSDGTGGSGVLNITSGYTELDSRYLYLLAYNGAKHSLSSVAADHQFTLLPVPDEVQ